MAGAKTAVLTRRGLLAIATTPLLGIGCAKSQPLRIGYVGELNDAASDLARSARNGALIAIQAAARLAELQGTVPELIVRDLGTTQADAERVATEMTEAGVAGVIGCVTSSGTVRMLPATTNRGLLLISPTASSLDLHGRDDLLFRINGTTRDNALAYARRCVQVKSIKRVAMAVTMQNRVFADSWAREFERAMRGEGGEVVRNIRFDASHGALAATAREMVSAPGAEGLVIVGNAVDAARLAQQLRKLDANRPLLASEWAASEQLIELGGRAVDGLELVQLYDRHDNSPAYLAFRESYESQFREAPGFGSMGGYDAAMVLMLAMRLKTKEMPLKDALRQLGPFQGLQQKVSFDVNGDNNNRKSFFVMVKNGKFAPADV